MNTTLPATQAALDRLGVDAWQRFHDRYVTIAESAAYEPTEVARLVAMVAMVEAELGTADAVAWAACADEWSTRLRFVEMMASFDR